MIPVFQTRLRPPGGLDQPPGNCWAACIASILELPIESVPDEATYWRPGMRPIESWRPYSQAVHTWLLQEYGLLLITVKTKQVEYEGKCFDTLAILSGQSPRHDKVLHAVVGQLTMEHTKIVHDPHPEGTGLAGPFDEWSYELFLKRFK